MLLLTVALFAPVALESPRYRDEALRVEKRVGPDPAITSLVIRHMPSNVNRVDLMQTTWSGSTIKTFDLADCDDLRQILSTGKGPDNFSSNERLSDGTPVISLRGAQYVGAASARYVFAMGATNRSGNALTSFGQWAEAALKTTEYCRAH